MLQAYRRWISTRVRTPANQSSKPCLKLECLENRDLPATLNFAVIGDYGTGSTGERQVADLVKSWNPEFVATLGDNNYPSGAASTIDQMVGKYYQEFIGNYSGKYGPGSADNRFFPALGNHDWRTRLGSPALPTPYLDYFSLPGNERYYTFSKGPVQFFVLDSGDGSGGGNDGFEPDGCSADSIQGNWLKQGLAASDKVWQVVLLHHPPFSSGDHGSTPIMQWPFREWGVDLVMSGHDHHYERIDKEGLTFLVNGLGGASLTTPVSPVDGSQVRLSGQYGALRCSATEQMLKMEMVSVSGKILDTFQIPSSASIAGSISGTTYLDLDGDGQHDSGEPGVSGTRFFLDRDKDGSLDGNEPVEVSDGQGLFSFTGLGPGDYRICLSPMPGQTPTGKPSVDVQLASGQDKAGIDFGQRPAPGWLSFPVLPVLFQPGSKDAATAYVENLYRALLGREGDKAGIQIWAGRIRSGIAPSTVVASFLNSDEWFGRVVDANYQSWLGRRADSSGRAYWIGRMRAGLSPESVASTFVASGEALSRFGGYTGLVGALYEGLLGRSPSAGERSYWVGALSNPGLSRYEVATQFIRSGEGSRHLVRSVYTQFLQRTPDKPGLDNWSAAYSRGISDAVAMIRAFASSPEFYSRSAS